MAKFAEDGQPTPSQVGMSQPVIRARQQQDNFGGTVLIIVLWTVNERGSNECNFSNKANALELTPLPSLAAQEPGYEEKGGEGAFLDFLEVFGKFSQIQVETLNLTGLCKQ